MIAKKLIGFLTIYLIASSTFAQLKNWDLLQIEIPQGLSSSQTKESFQYSNYNIKGSEPFSITLFKNQLYQGTLDTLFTFAWRKYVQTKTSGAEIPRWRRFYTEDGHLIQQGYLDDKSENGGYKQLNIFVLEGSFQACLIETDNLKSFRAIAGDWQDRITGIKVISKKK